MTNITKLQEEVLELLLAIGSADSTDQQLDRLDQLVLEHPELQEYVTVVMHQIGCIRWSNYQNVSSSLAGIENLVGQQDKCEKLPALTIDFSNLSDDVSKPKSILPRVFISSASPQALIGFGAFASLVLALFIWNSSNVPLIGTDTDVAVNERPAPVLDKQAPVFEPGSFIVDSGSMQMQIPKVGVMSVYGPTDIEILNPMRIRLNRGRIEVHVTQKSGYGFVVETPGGEVVDLGTKFLLNVDLQDSTTLAVLEGKVDLHTPSTPGSGGKKLVERFTRGEGVVFEKFGKKSRFMSIIANDYTRLKSLCKFEKDRENVLITNVTDNLAFEDVRNFYEIIPGGLGEDAPAFVDRVHQWNGLTQNGMPQELIGADYIRTFNDYKYHDSIEIFVEVSRPCTLYVFLDRRCSVPDWIKKDFHATGLKIGIDEGGLKVHPGFSVDATAIGPVESVDDYCIVWAREVDRPRVVRLGSQKPRKLTKEEMRKLGKNRRRGIGDRQHTNMFGIAAVAKEQRIEKQK